jgi:hypothetical protein
MEKINGKVISASNKEGKYGLNIGGIWFNGFGSAPANKGDEVEIEYEVNGTFKNPKKVTVTKLASATTKEISEDKNSSTLTSYAKDLVIAMLENVGKTSGKEKVEAISIPEAMKVATATVIEAYLEIKKSI